jgi:metal-responsive CopG/Arc/MetJ family transcriptional regulator
VNGRPADSPDASYSRLNVTCPPRIVELVDEAAAKTYRSRSEYTRHALIAQLRADGILKTAEVAA